MACKDRIPDSELEIMMIIWDAKAPVTCDYIMDKLDRSWVKPTVLNFLSRLAERGYLSIKKEGRKNLYIPLVPCSDYQKKESASFLKRVHHSSLKSLVASLYDGGEITSSDLAELKAYIEENSDG